jgi:hypothetical protein
LCTNSGLVNFLDLERDRGLQPRRANARGGQRQSISIPASEAAVVRYFQERMPYGLFVPDLQEPK